MCCEGLAYLLGAVNSELGRGKMMQEMLRERFKDNIELIERTLADGTTKLVPHFTHTHSPKRDVNTAADYGRAVFAESPLGVTG